MKSSITKTLIRILAYVVASFGYALLIAVGVLTLIAIIFVFWQEIDKLGFGTVALNILKFLGAVVLLFAAIGIWVAACTHVGWGGD